MTSSPDGADAAAFQALDRARGMAKKPGYTGRRRRPVPAEAGPGLGDPGSGARASGRDPQALGDVAAQLLEDRGWSALVEDAGVVAQWSEIVGSDIASHTVIESYEGGRLVIRASSTAWATQVKLLQTQLRRRIADTVGADRVREIVVMGPSGPSWKHGLRSVNGRGPRDTYG